MKNLIKITLSLLIVLGITFNNSYGLDKQGTTGKITGKVTDSKDKFPLVGATVKIESSSMGAITDDNGEYTILNVDVGTYTVTVSYIGFDAQSVSDVRVSADLTTNVDFSLKLSGSAITTDEIQIVGKRNAIQPDQSGKIIGSEFIDNSGLRGIENIAATTAGVVQDERGNSINIRGGRTNETSVFIDGVLSTNPLDGTSSAFVSNGVLQELAVLTGGFSAEYGNALSGIINVITKGGTDQFSGNLEVISDVLAGQTTSQGYNVYDMSVGGPLIPTKKLSKFINFFGGFERDYSLVSSPAWITRNFSNQEWIQANNIAGNNILPDFSLGRWSGNVKINFNFNDLDNSLPIQLKMGTSLSSTDRRLWTQSNIMFNAARNPLVNETSNNYYVKLNHQINSKMFYELQFNAYDASYEEGDPEFMGNFYQYADPSLVQGLQPGTTSTGVDEYGIFGKYNRVRSYYENSNTSYLGGTAYLTTQLKNNELKFGGEYRYNTIRYIDVRPNGMYGVRNQTEDQQLKAFNGAIGLANYYGYGPQWNPTTNRIEIVETDEGNDGAKHPIVAALYIQDKVEFKDFTLNAGVRWDYLDANSWRVNNFNNVVGADGILSEDDFTDESQATSEFSPRIGLSFPVTNNTVFHAQYGKFVQLPQLEFLYTGRESLDFWVTTGGFSGSFGNPNLTPEQTTAYEIGIKQQVGDKLSFDATVYYKETEDLIGIKKYPQLPNQIQVYANQDYGTIRGLDFMLDLRRTNRLSLNWSIGIAFASGTGSDPNSAQTAAWLGERQPKFTQPLDYDQRYTSSVNLDYRFGKTDVPKGWTGDVLSQLGLNLLYSFNSGRPYSLKANNQDPFAGTGAGAALLSPINGVYGPWNNSLDLKLDKTFSIWKFDLNAWVYIINLLDYELVNSVFESSGLPGNTGYLNSEEGKNTILSYNNPNGSIPTTSEEYVNRYTLRSETVVNYGPPRQFQFGLRLNF
jgi:outer membrane receptor protein involved in Fe transport